MNEQIEKQAIEEMRKDLIDIFDEEYEKRRIITADFTAIKMSAKGYRKQEWISVEDRLPDRCGRFLVYAKRTNSAGVLLCNYTPKYTFGEKSLMGRAVWFLYDSEWGDYEIEGVTHWMPLPEPPKMKGD